MSQAILRRESFGGLLVFPYQRLRFYLTPDEFEAAATILGGDSTVNYRFVPKNYLAFPTYLLLEVTRACNLRCAHCCNRSGLRDKDELSFEEIKGIIDQATRWGVLRIGITGGEPLLRPDLLNIFQYLERHDLLYVNLTTNGTLLNVDFCSQLAQLELHWECIRISLEGPEDVTDRIRGRGTFRRALVGLELLRRFDLPNVMFAVTLHALSLRALDAIFRMAEVYQVPLSMTLIRPTGRSINNQWLFDFSVHELRQGLIAIAEWNQAHPHLPVILDCEGLPYLALPREAENPLLGDLLSNPLFCQPHYGCVTSQMILVTYRGDVYPCAFLCDQRDILEQRFGILPANIRHGTLLELWHNAPIFRFVRSPSAGPKCNSCAQLWRCHGGCLAQKIGRDLAITDPDPFCWMNADNRTPRERE